MKNIKKFTVKNATITIDSATTLQFNHNKCFQLTGPYIFATAYKCEEYVLLHELQDFSTDGVIEPRTSKEFADGLLTMDNPYYVDYYHMLHDKISIMSDDVFTILQGNSYNEDIYPYKGDDLKAFHLFEANDDAWREVELSLKELHKKELFEWSYFASGTVQK
jgi:hypothetical protein